MLKPWLKSSSDNVPPQASTGCATPAPSAPPSGAPPPAPAPRGAVTTSSSQRVIDFFKIVFIFFRFGVCCAFSGGCGSVATYNNTYFSSGTAPASPCQMRVCRAGTEVSAATRHVSPRVTTCLLQVCQLRLNFDTFVIGQPSTSEPGDTDPNSRGSCIQVI